MVIPDEAVRYILFQRTAYLRFPIAPIYRQLDRYLPFDTPIYNIVVGVEAWLRRSRIKAMYRADMREEFGSIRDSLPARCCAVLDIGCGVAGIDVFIDRHYRGLDTTFYLLDKSRVERNVFYLFRERAAFYNSLEVARDLLTANGITRDRVHLVEANGGENLAIGAEVDLVLSLLAWGFHFPVRTYLDRVHEVLSDSGVVILDVRKGTDGIDVLRRRFEQVRIISEGKKAYRVAAAKQGRQDG